VRQSDSDLTKATAWTSLPGLRGVRPRRRRFYLRDGTPVTLRPLLPSDISKAQMFFAHLSARSRYYRFMRPVRDLDQSMVRALVEQSQEPGCGVLVAALGPGNGSEIIGGARYVSTHRRSTCEFAITVLDSWQRRGLGTMLLHVLQHDARAYGYQRMVGYVLAQNTDMLDVATRAGMRVQRLPGDASVYMVARALLWLPRRSRFGSTPGRELSRITKRRSAGISPHATTGRRAMRLAARMA